MSAAATRLVARAAGLTGLLGGLGHREQCGGNSAAVFVAAGDGEEKLSWR
jgi:hypothetical protein